MTDYEHIRKEAEEIRKRPSKHKKIVPLGYYKDDVETLATHCISLLDELKEKDKLIAGYRFGEREAT